MKLIYYAIGFIVGCWSTVIIIMGNGDLRIAAIGFVVTCYFAALIWRLK